jgi:hypothetical protein
MSDEAIDIYQAHLDISTRLVFRGDAEAYAAHAQLPFVFRTAQGVEVIETARDLSDDIHQLQEWLTCQGVTDYHRIARSARFLDEDTIEGFHVTYALRGATPVVTPYANRMILKRAGTIWKTSYAEHEIADALYPRRNAQARHGFFSAQWSAGPPWPVPASDKALPIYAKTVAAIAEAAGGEDFDAVHAHYTVPYQVHHDHEDYTIATPEDGRVFWDALHRSMAHTGADRVTVRPDSALFLSDTRILGYHDVSLTRDGETRFGPVRGRMILVLKDGRWLCTSVANALSTKAFQEGEFETSPDLPTLREIHERMKT